MTASTAKEEKDKDKGPKYTIDIEGTLHPWDQDTITTEQISALGGWDPQVGVVEIDKDSNERTLAAGEVIELKPGMGFQKKVKWKRGNAIEERVEREFSLLRERYPDAIRDGMWILVPSFPVPSGWSPDCVDIATFLRPGYPNTGPYGIYVPQELRHQGHAPDNYQPQAASPPPFPGSWAMLSWEAEGWFAAAEPQAGHNLLTWTEGFTKRFKEGR